MGDRKFLGCSPAMYAAMLGPDMIYSCAHIVSYCSRHMTLLPGSDVWHYSRRMPIDTRTTYEPVAAMVETGQVVAAGDPLGWLLVAFSRPGRRLSEPTPQTGV